MHAAVRSSLMTAVALVGASVIAVTPVAPPPPEIRVASPEVRLAAASLLNVPLNLAIDLVNIPYNEVQAVDFMAKSLFFSGPWMVVSNTNLWGVDPGDPSHFQSVVNFLVPFPALSGMLLDQNDQKGLGQQLWQTVAVMLPVSSSCDAYTCTPNVPTSPITGVAGVDSSLWVAAMLTGQLQLPLIANWFSGNALLQMLSPAGYAFGPNYPGYVDPSGPAYPLYNLPGTTVGPNGENLMPWASTITKTTFKLNPFTPLVSYFDHLMADPAENPIQLPTLEQVGRALQALLAASVMAFDPLTEGSPFCSGTCSTLPAGWDYPDIVRMIGDFWPGNTVIDTWLAAYDKGKANVPTQDQIDRSIKILQQKDFWDFGNAAPPASYSPGFNLSSLAPGFHKMWTDFGFDPPPLNTNEPDLEPPTKPGPVQEPVGGDAPTNGPVGLLAFEKVSQPTLPQVGSTTTSTNATDEDKKSDPSQVNAMNAPQDGAIPPQGGATPPQGGATPPAQTGGLTQPPDVNRLRPHRKGPETPNAGTTPTETGGPTGTPPKPGNPLGEIVNKFVPHKQDATTTGTGTGTSTDASSTGGASSNASSTGGASSEGGSGG
jgi:hypothetical protein